MEDPKNKPRFSGIPTFMRTTHVPNPKNLDADFAFLGIPWDGDSGNRIGSRYAPQAIRNASRMIKPYNPAVDVSLHDYEIVDNDDVLIIPGQKEDTYNNIENRVEKVIDQNVVPIFAGGNHGISLSILRAMKSTYGELSLVHFDAHSDQGKSYFGGYEEHPPGTFVTNAIDEGLISAENSVRIGERGTIYDESYLDRYNETGLHIFNMGSIQDSGISNIGDAIGEIPTGPTYITFDIDVIDPAFAPGTTVPEPGGLSTREAIRLIRSLSDIDIVGFDMVEVCPPYDDNTHSTSILAARLINEMMCSSIK